MMDDKTKSMLEARMEPDYGLLDSLLKSRTLSRSDIEDIKSAKTISKKNRKLLSYIEKKDAIEELKNALAEENQMHLVNFINSFGVYQEEFGNDWPLSNNETEILDFNQGKLVEILDPTELIGHLYSKKIINARQRNFLNSKKNESKQNEKLIEIWWKTSRSNYFKIIECLDISGQSRIGNILKNGGAIYEFHVTMNGEEKCVEASENHIVKTIKGLLKGKTQEEQTRIMELVQLGGDEVQLISAMKSGSIALYFHCTTVEGLVHLRDLMFNGRLKTIVETTFIGILRSCDAAFLTSMDEEGLGKILKSTDDTDVFTIRWPSNNYNICETFLQEGSGLKEKKESSLKLIIAHEQVCEMTKCCICKETFNNPRSLPCLHTFCRNCLERCAENKSPRERIGCPVCRQQWKIPVNGVDGFPRNNWVDKWVELGNNSGNVSKKVLCDMCSNSIEYTTAVIPVAVKHCIECQQNMCKECSIHHSRQKLSWCHDLINLEGLEKIERAKITSSTCDKHARKPMVIYCLDCQTTICQICFNESHGGHKSEEVRNIAKRMQTDLDGVADSMTNLVAEVEDAMKENPQTLFLNRVSETEIEIRDRSEKVMKIVENHRARLFEYLGIVKSRIQKEYGMTVYDLKIHLGEIRSVLKRIQDLKAQGSISDITGIAPNLLSKAQELQKNHQIMCTKLKNQTYTELVPIDIDDLLLYNSGNIIGKIRVNTCNLEGDHDYYKFAGLDVIVDDCYKDCALQPRVDAQSQILAECKVTFNTGSESEGSEDEYERIEDYGPICSAGNDSQVEQKPPASLTEDSQVKQALPVPVRADKSPGSLQTFTGNPRGHEIRPSTINLERRLRRGKFTEIWLAVWATVKELESTRISDP